MEYLQQLLFLEFEKFSSTNIKLTCGLLQYIAAQLLQEEDSVFTPQDIDLNFKRPIISHITCKWIDSFLSRFNFVLRDQSGSLSRSPSHKLMVEKFFLLFGLPTELHGKYV